MARKRFLLRRFWRRIRPPRRLRVTREGKYFLAVTIAIGMAAVNTGNNLLYLLLAWLLSVIIGSGILSDLSLRGLRVRRRPPPRVHANRPFLMQIAVENTKRKQASFSVEIEDLIKAKPLDKKCYFLKIPSGRTQTTSYRHTFGRRGRYEFDGFRIASKYPFAFFRKSRDVDSQSELIVYPQVYPVPLPAPRARNLGETAADQIGRHGEFFGLREYRDGDDRRDIHWRSTARTGRLMVREYEREAQQRATIFLDNALPEHATETEEDAFEEAISLAASLATTYIASGYGVRLVTRTVLAPWAAGPPQLGRIMRSLALLEPASEDQPMRALQEMDGDGVMVVPKGVRVAHPRIHGVAAMEAG